MDKFVNPRCEKCGHHKHGHCLLKDEAVRSTDLCQHYTESPYICEICGRHLFYEGVNYTYGDKTDHHLVCISCFSILYTCQTCKRVNTCKFEQDSTVPEPPYVMYQMQEGPALIQKQVKNPKRINLTCKVNCPCFVNEQCSRENGSCDKYQCSVENW